MRDVIARALVWVLRMVLPARGRHGATEPATSPEPAPVNPWSRPWTSPSKEEARAIFERQAETTMKLGIIHERRRAAELATMGVDYPYTYPGAPFTRSAFAAAGVSA
ncbi:hypothetical protein AB0903_29885 [Streptomyces sp. NPDC048389]|uniref:hypothetical protein n=1 Tax=Streptomyces sp. NPDC048389 TaxID=3154622 RepID=UPI00345534B1